MSDHEREFLPLPFYPFDERPETVPLDADECATAIYLSEGHLPKAAALLKVPLIRLKRMLRGSPRLQRVFEEVAGLLVDRAFSKYIEALDAPDARRQEWGASAIMKSRAAQGHLFSPAPASTFVTEGGAEAGTIIFRWGNGQVLGGEVNSSPLIEGTSSDERSSD